jgi:hypothetical protein
MYDYDDSILANPSAVEAVIPDMRQAFTHGEFADLEGVALAATYSGRSWREVLEDRGVIFPLDADLWIDEIGRLVILQSFLGRIT